MTIHSTRFGFRALVAGVSALVLTSGLQAAISLGENSRVQIGGFFSQGYLKSEGNNYPTEDRTGTFDFREMAFNASTSVGSHLRLGAQAFAQRLGNYGEDKVLLDWAVADYNFNQQFGVRVGRIKYPKGLYGEALDLDAVRPFIFLPSSLYNPVVRDFNASFNGGMIYGTFDGGKSIGSFDYKVFYGDIPMNQSQGISEFFLTGGSYKTPPGIGQMGIDYAAGVSLDWTTPINGLKGHLSYSYLKNVFARGQMANVPIVVPFSISLDRIGYTTVGVEYTWHEWTFASEYQRSGSDLLASAPPFVNSPGNFGVDNYYFAISRRIGSKFQVGSYLSKSKNIKAAPTARKIDTYNDDYTLCVRFDPADHVIFKVEAHYVDGLYNVFNTARTPNPTAKREDTTTYFAAKTTLFF